MSTEIRTYQKKVPNIVAEAESLEITDASSMQAGAELLSRVNKTLDAIDSEEEKVLAPMKEAMKAEKARWAPMREMLKPVVQKLRDGMSAYQTAEQKRVKEEKERLASRVGEGKGKLKLETAVAKMDEVETPDEVIAGSSGLVKFRTVKELVIDDATLIPREYLVPDEKAIKAALGAGKSVKGARLEEKQVPVNFR